MNCEFPTTPEPDDGLTEALRQWRTPQPQPSLDDRVMSEFRRRNRRFHRQRGAVAMLVAASVLCAWTLARPNRVRVQEQSAAAGHEFVVAAKMQRCLPCANHYDQAVNCHQSSVVKALY